MKISIITITYNAIKVIEKTIQSVVKQKYDDIEYIIIDGGSTDGTIDIIKQYENKISLWISEPDKGIYDAMNKGIKLAKGEWINFMNAGDYFYDNLVLSKFSEIAKQSNADIIYGEVIKRLPSIIFPEKPMPLSFIKNHMVFSHQSTFIKASYHKKYLFNDKFKSSGDYHFFYNSYYNWNARFQYIPTIIAYYDESQGMSKDNWKIAYKENCTMIWDNHSFVNRFKNTTGYWSLILKKTIISILPTKWHKFKQIKGLKAKGCDIIES